MQYPNLLSPANPRGPRWSEVGLSNVEADELFRCLVMIVGFNDRTGTSEVLGSGFLVATRPYLLLLTATHVITEWIDKVRPPALNSFAGLFGDTSLPARLKQLVEANLIRAVVHCANGEYRLCKIASISVMANPRECDVACLRLHFPKDKGSQDFGCIRVDADAYPWDEPVFMGGFVAGSSWQPPTEEDEPFRVTQNMRVRVGYCRGIVEKPNAQKYPMFQLNMPSLPGMSGGPILAMRYPNGRPRIISSVRSTVLTAIGIVSRDYMTESYLLDGSDPGETLAVPIEEAFCVRVPETPNEDFYIANAVRDGMIVSYGNRARSAQVRTGPNLDEVSIRFMLSAPTRWVDQPPDVSPPTDGH